MNELQIRKNFITGFLSKSIAVLTFMLFYTRLKKKYSHNIKFIGSKIKLPEYTCIQINTQGYIDISVSYNRLKYDVRFFTDKTNGKPLLDRGTIEKCIIPRMVGALSDGSTKNYSEKYKDVSMESVIYQADTEEN